MAQEYKEGGDRGRDEGDESAVSPFLKSAVLLINPKLTWDESAGCPIDLDA